VNVDESKFTQWIQKVIATEEEEISCSECFDLVSEYVDTELAGGEFSGALRQVGHHLNQCRACRDEYDLLRDFVIAEENAHDSPGNDSPGSNP